MNVDGPMPIPLPSPRVAVVGMRSPTPGGIERAGWFAESLAGSGAIIVSGLARGIDTAAHMSAIRAGGRTVAVLGTPLDVSYPPENAALQETIMKGHLVVSQFTPGIRVVPVNFTARNRTIALISDASLIVEAGSGGGTMNHAWEALRMGRQIFFDRSALESCTHAWQKRMFQYGATVVSEPGGLLARLGRP